MKKLIMTLIGISAVALIVGCSVSQKKLDDVENRIATLTEKGVPDSALSRAKVFLYQANDAKKRGNMGLARMSGDSMQILVAKAEAQYEDNMKRLKPFIESQKKDFIKEIAILESLHKKSADSLVAIVDSFVNINWLLQAETKSIEYMKAVKMLQLAQEKAKELKPKVVGTWVCTEVTKHSADRTVHAVQTKTFTFNKNGSATFAEQKKGKSTPYFKEDWLFKSFGKWDMKGDTVFVFVERFDISKQNFWDYKKDEKGRKTWVKIPAPTYDSAITDGSQDRYVQYDDLLLDFKKK